LTGDKEETAVNISYAAGHLSYDMEPLSLTRQANAEECGATLDSFIKL
jgi:magnesium-transporting ATPase (P-type)